MIYYWISNHSLLKKSIRSSSVIGWLKLPLGVRSAVLGGEAIFVLLLVDGCVLFDLVLNFVAYLFSWLLVTAATLVRAAKLLLSVFRRSSRRQRAPFSELQGMRRQAEHQQPPYLLHKKIFVLT